MKALQLFLSSQSHFTPKFICLDKKDFSHLTQNIFFGTDFRKEGKYGESQEAEGAGKHKGSRAEPALCFTCI